MDRRTDRQTEFSSVDRVCIPCSKVKTMKFEGWMKVKFNQKCPAAVRSLREWANTIGWKVLTLAAASWSSSYYFDAAFRVHIVLFKYSFVFLTFCCCEIHTQKLLSVPCTTWTLLLVVSLLLLRDFGILFHWTVELLHPLTHLRSVLRPSSLIRHNRTVARASVLWRNINWLIDWLK